MPKNQAQGPDNAQLASRILTDYQRSYKAKLPKETLFRDVYSRYRSYLERSRTASRSTLFIPESFTVVETVAPRMVAQKPAASVLPRTSEFVNKADAASNYLDYVYDRSGKFQKHKNWSKQGLIYGTSFVKKGWDKENELPTTDVVDVADLFGDPSTYSWQEGFVIHRFYATAEELKRSGVKYKNLDVLEMRESTAKDDMLRQYRDAVQGVPYEPMREGAEILEHWCREPEDGKIWVRAVANRSVLIRNEVSPLPLDKYPFIPFFDQAVPFDRWGIGEIEPIIDLQDEENTTRNQRVDEKNLSIHNMWVVSKMAGVDYKKLVSKPGGIILANDINGIKPLEKQNITQDSIQEINLIKADIKQATGVNDFSLGAYQRNGTATEASLASQETNVRFSEKISNLEIAMKEDFEWDLALGAEFMTKKAEYRIEGKFGPEFVKITPDDLKGEFDIQIETGSSMPSNPDLRRQQLTQLTELLVPVLSNPNGIPDGVRELLRSLIQSFDLKNADDILQSAQHPLVSQAMAGLTPDEMQGANPQMVEAEIKRRLMSQGSLSGGQQPLPQQTGQAPQGARPQQPMVPTPGR